MLEYLTLKPEAFGLDISDLSIKIIKLKKSSLLTQRRKFLGLASFGEFPIKPGIIKDGEIKDEKALVNVIKEGILKVSGKKLRTKYVIASLPEEKAFLQVIQMPIMAEKELMSAVFFEAENYIPVPIDEVYLDSQIVPPLYDHLDHVDVLIAALPKKIIDPYLSCLKKAGLVPLAFEIESQAIARAIVKNEVSPVPLLLMDLGATRTGFTIFSGYSLRFTTSIPVHSRRLTEVISKSLKVGLKEAEKLKRKYGLKQKNKEGKLVYEALLPKLTDLVRQIRKYISYYLAHASHEHLPPNGKGVSKILLCGGGANLKGLTDFLSLELKLPVELANPWVNILPRPLKEVPELPYKESLGYTTALGLALRGIKE